MGVRELLYPRREDILRIAARHGARNVRVFGSVARGEDGVASDVDFLVEMAPDHSLLDRIALKHDLEDLLSRRVDVLMDRSVCRLLRRRILKEAQPL